MTTPILKITDGTTTINLLSTQSGILLKAWQPAITAPKDGGVWQSSPFADGRRMAMQRWENVIETFTLTIGRCDQDEIIADTQTLRQLLQKGVEYWTAEWQNEPVWIAARAPGETNTRYALIYDWRTPSDNNPFAQPFFGVRSVMDDWTLVIERGHWLSNAPGAGDCVQLSALQDYYSVTQVNDTPAESGDDCWYDYDQGINLTDNDLIFGAVDLGAYTVARESGIRFRGVAVPQGAQIRRAWMVLDPSANLSTITCKLKIVGEAADSAAIYTTAPNYVSRTLTTNVTYWDSVPAFVIGITKTTPDLSPIIQEIVDRPGWVSGNDLALRICDNGSSDNVYRQAFSWDDVAGTPPTLYIEYVSTDTEYGQEATCADQVYVANKHNIAQLTHIFRYDASVPSYTQIHGAAKPVQLLPAVPANSDMIYFGIDSTMTDSGPFVSLVFDIGTAAVDIPGVWQYWTAAGWANLIEYQDNTVLLGLAGVHSLHWRAHTDWATQTVNGVTAYWIRFNVNSPLGGGAVSPTQANRDVYTAVTPFVDIAAAQTSGDLPTIAQIKVRNVSCNPTAYPTSISKSNAVIAGLRSLARGANFSAYINLADEQNNPGIRIGVYDDTAFADQLRSATGRAIQFTPTDTSNEVRVLVDFSASLVNEYIGRYRAYLRTINITASPPVYTVKLGLYENDSLLMESAEKDVPATVSTACVAIDMGEIAIAPLHGAETFGDLSFKIWGQASSASGSIYLCDLVLMPIDEWAGEFHDPSSDFAWAVTTEFYVDADSITKPKRGLITQLRRVSDDARIAGWQAITSDSQIILQASSAQRLWFMTKRLFSGADYDNHSYVDMCHTVRVNAVKRYYSARGGN